jgi:hypothetical protein
MVSQFVIQLDKRPGSFARLARALAARNIDISGMFRGGSGSCAYAVLTTEDEAAVRAVLRASGLPFVEGQTILVSVEDRPHGLATVRDKLAAAGVAIERVLFVDRSEGRVETALAVDDAARARTVLDLPVGGPVR